ncbi:sulfotransferase domain-containing protein [Tsuneonella mangrovi]|uniref:sulfotransferase domain-containing protein n=1 Tax=Tsuneonella mangrovi TaxID=1982042 RepID=UPI000BA26057|nr:sulfotransferase domain-containing protein [Tsuneonella mangrovi]
MTVGIGRRARNMEELGQNLEALHAFEPVDFKPYAPQEGDVFISSWAKSGTTMMQQMFHQLRMGAATGRGDMDFDDISRMTPWEDSAMMCDFDMTVEQRAAPRGFKSHREYERLPAGMRYIVTLRDPHETYRSFHRFFEGYLLERGAMSLEDFFPLWMLGGPGGCDYFTHLLSWYARRNEPDTLLAPYHWAAKNRPAMIRRMADFLGIELTDELAAMVEAHTEREFMYAHKDKFNDKMMCDAMEQRLGISEFDSTKVHQVGSSGKDLPPSVVEQIDAMWAERVEPVTGHADFASLEAELVGSA